MLIAISCSTNIFCATETENVKTLFGHLQKQVYNNEALKNFAWLSIGSVLLGYLGYKVYQTYEKPLNKQYYKIRDTLLEHGITVTTRKQENDKIFHTVELNVPCGLPSGVDNLAKQAKEELQTLHNNSDCLQVIEVLCGLTAFVCGFVAIGDIKDGLYPKHQEHLQKWQKVLPK
jgi:hypothetical protein